MYRLEFIDACEAGIDGWDPAIGGVTYSKWYEDENCDFSICEVYYFDFNVGGRVYYNALLDTSEFCRNCKDADHFKNLWRIHSDKFGCYTDAPYLTEEEFKNACKAAPTFNPEDDTSCSKTVFRKQQEPP